MATFELIDDATYRVEGEITPEDVEQINAFKIRTNLVLSNTKGQSSKTIEMINTNNVYFTILGGLDYFQKQKYHDKQYIERTQSAPKGLAKILQYFEKIESEMKPEWTDTQKCMYAYNALAVDTDYVKHLKQDILSPEVTERGLNGVLYNQLTCAGMAQTFKEMMDRIGIKCYYQNQRNKHSFNVVELEGKLRGIDVTWDCTKTPDEKCTFENFGRKSNFYQQYGHLISGDSEETQFDLTIFTDEEIQENYAVIESAINQRSKIVNQFRNMDRERKRTFLPVDTFKEQLESEGKILAKIKLLDTMGSIPEDISGIVDATKARYGFVLDYVKREQTSEALNEMAQAAGLDGRLVMKDGQLLISRFSTDGNWIEEPLTDTEHQAISAGAMEDITQYYTTYFLDGALQIDDMIETLASLENMPPEMLVRTATLRTQFFTKIQLFAKADKFFEKIGILNEQVEMVSGKAKGFLAHAMESKGDESVRTRHENDLDFLYAIIQNDIIDIASTGRSYSQSDLLRLMDDVRENWTDAEFSDEEFKILLDEALGKTIIPTQISQDTINASIGIQDMNAVADEIRETQILDVQQENSVAGNRDS